MVNFTPGPSELYFTVPDHLRRALKADIPSLSHRSKAFEGIFRDATEGLNALLAIPEGFHIAFAGSATEIWERSLQSLAVESSFHLVNGAFSKRFSEISAQLGKKVTVQTVPDGQGFDELTIPPGQEFIAITQNETSTGISLPAVLIQSVRNQQPEALLVVDAVSSLPYASLDFSTIDSVFFSVQKGFGLPAGLGVWIYNERCLERSRQLQAAGKPIGTYHSLPSLHSFGLKHQTPETPNVLSIYLLGKVAGDFLRRGIAVIRKETEYKAAVLYGVLDNHATVKPFVNEPGHRSNTVITVSCPDHIQQLSALLESKGLQPGDGYGPHKASQLRFANFPAHSKETYEMLADLIAQF